MAKKDAAVDQKTRTRKPKAVPVTAEERIDELVGTEMVRTDEEAAALVAAAYGIVPLDEQLTETELALKNVLQGEVVGVESSGDAAVAERPWESWPAAEFVEVEKLSNLTLAPTHEGMQFQLPGDPEPTVLGAATRRAMENLSWHIHYPVEFVQKLSFQTQAAVINERIAATRDRKLVLAREAGKIVNLAYKHHEMIEMSEVADLAYDLFSATFGNVEILTAAQAEGGMALRLSTPRVEREVTTRRGDVLRLGIDLRYGYGERMKVSLFTTRLVCINGLICDVSEWGWDSKLNSTVDAQKLWLRERIEEMVPKFNAATERARVMATNMLGDTRTIAEEAAIFARQHGFQLRHVPFFVDAWNQMSAEEENVQRTQWDLLNAFTRAMTHDPRLREFAFDGMVRAGNWVRGNELVVARLRRATAERVHAEILDGEGTVA